LPKKLCWLRLHKTALVGVCLLFSACGAPVAEPSRSTSPESAAPAAAATEEVVLETWDAYYVQGVKAGFIHTKVTRLTRGNGALLRTEQLLKLKVERSGQPFEATLTAECVERPEGGIESFRASIPLGARPLEIRGQAKGDTLQWQRIAGGQAERMSDKMPAGLRGFAGVEQSIADQPMEPGHERTIAQLQLPPQYLIDQVKLSAADYEPVELLSGTFELLKIREVSRLPDGGTLEMTLWANREGEVLKSYTELGKIEIFRTTRELAESTADDAKIDLAFDVAVPLDRRLPNGRETRRAVYEVTMDGGDPAKLFPQSAGQQVAAHDAGAALVTVTAVEPLLEAAASSQTDPSYLRSSSLAQRDDPRVAAMAREAADKSLTGWPLAVALEKYVRQKVAIKDYSQAFASAAEVAVTRQGDCTEHAVLLAALLRARGVPARAAMGLVYQDRGPTFAYHMWNEAWINGQWVPLDATLGRGGIGATHLKLADSNLAGAAAYSSFLPVLQVMGRLQVRLVEAE
jgi:hypothetical protein